MKILAGEIASILASRGAERPRMGTLVRFVAVLGSLIAIYATIFKFLMTLEGQEHSWVTSVYWVLTVMSTLGFGDITFQTDIGRAFSIVVLMSGTLFLLVLLPFLFIEFFYQPFMAAQKAARTPRALKAGTKNHVIITHLDAVAAEFIKRLESYKREYALMVKDTEEGLRLLDHGYRVVVGALDDPETYRRLRAADASLIAATGSDPANTLVASTVREVSDTVPIIATADDSASIDVLVLAGCHQVLHLSSQMAASFARRVTGGDNLTHVIGEYDKLQIAEANTVGTRLVGSTIKDSGVRESSGVGIVGVWDRGAFQPALPDTVLTDHTVLLLAGSHEQLHAYDRAFCQAEQPQSVVLILGGGRVGRATARALQQRGIDYYIVEKNPSRPGQDEHWVIGNAAELSVLREAGIDQATTIVITTHVDDLNVYLTLYCRRLNQTAKILSRSTDRRNVSSLHRAGADFVLSYASMGASLLFNSLEVGAVMNVAEGLNLFVVDIPDSLRGKQLIDSSIRVRTGATVVAIEGADGERTINPPPEAKLGDGCRLIMIGDAEAEEAFQQGFA